MTTTYKVTGQFDGVVYASFKNGMLDMLITEKLNFNLPDSDVLHKSFFPMRECDLQACTEVFKVIELKPTSVADKVALFCVLYRHYKKVPYRAMKEEKANLKTVTVNDHLLNTYFTHVNYPLSQTKSMADYVRHYNTVRDLSANGTKAKSKFPDVYDKQYEQMISDDVAKLQRYWQHLRDLGWKKDDGVWKQVKQQTNG